MTNKPASGHDLSGVDMAKLQGLMHDDKHDYFAGSPHIKHREIRNRVVSAIDKAVGEVITRKGQCAVLEIGAGHGTFTDTALRAGATVTVTEMSRTSAEHLSHRYNGHDDVSVVVDPDGEECFRLGERFDVVLFISVIHHIPDYLGLLDRLTVDVVERGGAVVCFQDPLWYPRQSRLAKALSWGSYFAWRVPRGNIKRGLATRWRHLRGIRNDSVSDTVEYHVVRDGVDDYAIVELLDPRFAAVERSTYFATQSVFFQNLGSSRFPPNMFSLVATSRL